jgi:SAM-dependent MidA family methyltransferase
MDGHGVVHVSAGFPQPDAAALAHCQAVEALLRREIVAAGGSIGLGRFMELALYAPGLGYYSAGARKLGAGGDFITAPELAPVFSRCVASQCAEVLQSLGGGVVLEFGAGSGAMACGMLGEFARRGQLPEYYLILEVSADLRARQQARVATLPRELARRVHWLDEIPRSPLRGVIVANEVLDSLPVLRLRVCNGTAVELGVACGAQGFHWIERGAPAGLPADVTALLALCPDGYETEFSATLAPWVAAVAAALGSGVVLLLDYGYPRREYYHPQRTRGTLRCHYRHRAHDDPFLWPGLQDITAAVDFTAVASAAVAAGLALRGFTTQAHFLIGCGLERQLAGLPDADVRTRTELSRQVQVLTLPAEMGEVVKAMALARDFDAPLAGFRGPDHRNRL